MLLPALLAFQSLVAGETCPAPADVELRVRGILHLSPERELNEGFVVERHEAGLYVELQSADSVVIGQRTLPAEGSCDDLAQAAAVVLSAWLSDVHPDFAGALAPSPAPVETPPEPEPAPAPPAPPQAPISAPAPAMRAVPPAPRAAPADYRTELGLAAGVDGADGKPALAAYAVCGYVPSRRGWGMSGFLSAVFSRVEALGPGHVAWRRWPLGLGPSLSLGGASTRWDFNAGPALAWLHFTGTDFDQPSSQDGLAFGGFLSLKLTSRGRHLSWFGLANAQIFPGDYRALANGQGEQWAFPLPHFSFGLAVGGWVSP